MTNCSMDTDEPWMGIEMPGPDHIPDDLLMQTSCPKEDLVSDEMKCAQILETAAKLVSGNRNVTHGSKQENFDNTAAMWSAYLGVPLTAEQVCWCMVLLKISRTKCGAAIEDHYIDAAGYAAIAGEVRR